MRIPKINLSRMMIATLSAIAGLCILNAWAYQRLHSTRNSAQIATANTTDADRLVGQIRDLQLRKSVATTTVFSESDLVRRLETVAQQAQIPASRLLRISPEAPRRQKDSPYMEQAIGLTLGQVTLPQAMQFFGQTAAGTNGLRVRTLRFSPSAGSDSPEAWKVDATLVYFIFSPITADRKNGTVLP